MRSRNRHVGSTLRSAHPASSSGCASSSSKAPRRWCAPLNTKRNASNSLKAWAWRSCSISNSCAFVGLCGGVAARTAEGGGALNAARMSPLGTWTSGRTGVSKVDICQCAAQRAGGFWLGAAESVRSRCASSKCLQLVAHSTLLAREAQTASEISVTHVRLLLCRTKMAL